MSLARRRGSAVRAIDAFEIRAILDALVAVRMLRVIETGDPAAREPEERAMLLAFATPV